ncbi:MAG: energy transducer TonB [Muricauda sp.]|nr:energy transducer TonB [Allomuricauda sp.]MBC32258.1 energy transducer TonB [Allomuricauda sp.]|tara:strand:- start:4 stop:729 length:726 start_codon:yes stop_codon:yes gene_type:complete
MRSKKNPQVDLSRNSSLYFMVGLTVALFTIWQLLEYKTYETEDEFVQVLEVAEDIKEEVPVTQQIRTAPPPPPPAAPAVIEVVEDELEIEETIIESTESSQETEVAEAVVSVDDVEVGEEEEEISVPFAIIENAPIFPGCENLSTEAERRECFNRKVQEHIKKNFTYPKTALELGIQGRVFVKFDIDSQGRVANIQKRGPDRLLEEEAARIIAALPKVKPGQQRGRPTKVAYSIPINFVMQ